MNYLESIIRKLEAKVPDKHDSVSEYQEGMMDIISELKHLNEYPDSRSRLGKHLLFISQINRDGCGVSAVSEETIQAMQNERFEINCLSITYGTYIASGFNSYVVKLNEFK